MFESTNENMSMDENKDIVMNTMTIFIATWTKIPTYEIYR